MFVPMWEVIISIIVFLLFLLFYCLNRLNYKACQENIEIIAERQARVRELREGLDEIQDKLYDDADELAERLFRNITDQDYLSPTAKHDDICQIHSDLRDLKTKYQDRVRELVR